MKFVPGGPTLFGSVVDFLRTCPSFVVFAPYIRGTILSELLKEAAGRRCEAVVTTWRPRDIVFGSSDLAVYDECRSREIPLLLNSRLHLKAYVDGRFQRALITTANISASALGLRDGWNHEAGVVCDPLGLCGATYLDDVISESLLVTEQVYAAVVSQAALLPPAQELLSDFVLPMKHENQKFRLVDLPLSVDPLRLKVLMANPEMGTDEERRSAAHDVSLYGLGECLPEGFESALKRGLFASPAIRVLLEFNGAGKRFGELTAWLHDNLADVPAPRRFDVKEALQRVLAFVTYLAPEAYRLERFGRFTETLTRLGEAP